MRHATLLEMEATGFDGLTVRGVAARAGLHRSTVYRGWGNTAGLAADALDLVSAASWPLPDTGGLGSDLRALTTQIVEHLADPVSGGVLRALVTGAERDPGGVAHAVSGLIAAGHERAVAIVVRAVRRGELPVGTDAREVVRMAVAPLYHRLFLTGETVDRRMAIRYAEAARAAARAGVFARGDDCEVAVSGG